MALKSEEEADITQGLSVQVVLMMLLLCACGVVGIWRSSSKRRQESEERLPPAPPGWPILGHLHLLGKLPHRSLAELARQYAPHLMFLRLGRIPILVASSPDAARLILHTHDHIFCSRPQPTATRHLTFNYSNIGLSPMSPYWRRMRTLCTTDLFTNARIRSFRRMRQMEMHALLRSVWAKQGQLLVLRTLLAPTILNMVSKMTVGQSLSELAAQNNRLGDIGGLMDEVMRLSKLPFHWGDFFPFLARFDVLLGHERAAKLLGERFSTALQVVLDLRRAARQGQKDAFLPKDFLDVLLAVPDITDDNVKAVIMDMFLGGADTTMATVEWVLAELLANPIALSTLQDELDQVVGKSRLVEEEDIPNLPYLDAVVKEAMRLHPPAPLLLPHESIEACQVFNYIIPPKTCVIVNVWALGRDSNAWENPLKFDPKRFMPNGRYNQVAPYGKNFEFLPFGAGRRKCPALYLGLLEVHMMVAIILQSFDVSLPLSNSKDQINLSEKAGLVVPMACPLAMTLIPRIAASLYQNAV